MDAYVPFPNSTQLLAGNCFDKCKAERRDAELLSAVKLLPACKVFPQISTGCVVNRENRHWAL